VNDKVDLAAALATFDESFSPRVVGTMNDYKLMTIQLRDRDVVLGPGELYVVPRGVEHCPKGTADVLLIEPTGTVNTGDAPTSALTAPERPL
jgi:hypothetical protein